MIEEPASALSASGSVLLLRAVVCVASLFVIDKVQQSSQYRCQEGPLWTKLLGRSNHNLKDTAGGAKTNEENT